MFQLLKYRLRLPGLMVGLAGGLVLFVVLRADRRSAPPETGAGTSAVEVRPASPARVAAADDPLPSPDASATDEELLALARKIVARSPERAIAWARSQSDAVLCRRLLSAVVQAWGKVIHPRRWIGC